MELEQLALEKNFSKLLFNINSKKEKSYKDYHNIAVLNFFGGNKEEAMSFFNENKGKNALTLLVYAFISMQSNSSVENFLSMSKMLEDNIEFIKSEIQTYFLLGECYSKLYDMEKATMVHATGLSMYLDLGMRVCDHPIIAYLMLENKYWFQHCAECPLNYLYVENDNPKDMFKMNKIFDRIGGDYSPVFNSTSDNWIWNKKNSVFSKGNQCFPFKSISVKTKPRIGYISENLFSRTSVNRIIFPIIEHHSDKFDFYYFSFVENFIHGCGETILLCQSEIDQAAKIINDLNLDILVDVDGRTNKNKVVKLLKQKLSRVYITYCGYPCTNGTTNFDYKIVDNITDPPDYADEFYTEKLLYTPGCFLTFRMYDTIPDFENINDNISIGAFHNIKKISKRIGSVWKQILEQNKTVNLYLKYATYDPNKPGVMDMKDDFDKYFIQKTFGDETNRIVVLPYTKLREENFKDLNKLDIFLDTYPYTSTITALEVLCMGIPIVTLAGKTHRSRVTASILTHIGHTELIANTDEEYIKIVSDLIKDKTRLKEYRKILSEDIKKIMNYKKFASELEEMYADILSKIKYTVISTNDSYVFNALEYMLNKQDKYYEYIPDIELDYPYQHNTVYLTYSKCPESLPDGCELIWIPGTTGIDESDEIRTRRMSNLDYDVHRTQWENCKFSKEFTLTDYLDKYYPNIEYDYCKMGIRFSGLK